MKHLRTAVNRCWFIACGLLMAYQLLAIPILRSVGVDAGFYGRFDMGYLVIILLALFIIKEIYFDWK